MTRARTLASGGRGAPLVAEERVTRDGRPGKGEHKRIGNKRNFCIKREGRGRARNVKIEKWTAKRFFFFFPFSLFFPFGSNSAARFDLSFFFLLRPYYSISGTPLPPAPPLRGVARTPLLVQKAGDRGGWVLRGGTVWLVWFWVFLVFLFCFWFLFSGGEGRGERVLD